MGRDDRQYRIQEQKSIDSPTGPQMDQTDPVHRQAHVGDIRAASISYRRRLRPVDLFLDIARQLVLIFNIRLMFCNYNIDIKSKRVFKWLRYHKY